MTPNLSIGAPVEVTMGHGAKVVGKIISRDPIVVEYEAPEGTQRKEADWSYMRPMRLASTHYFPERKP